MSHCPAIRPRLRCAITLLLGLCLGTVEASEPTDTRAVPLAEVIETPVFSAPATVVADNEPQLTAEIDAVVVEITVQVGDRVSRGEVLARLDCRRYQAALDSARAALSRAQAQRRFAEQQLVRARNLTRNQSISEELLDQRRTDLALADADQRSAAATTRLAELDVEHCAITAPIDAVVTRREAAVGNFVNRGMPILALVEDAGLEVSVPLRNDQFASLQAAPRIEFESDGRRLPLALRVVVPVADPISRTREARLAFVADSELPGSAGRVIWQGSRPQLPAEFLVRRDGALGVFVVDDGRARFVRLAGAQEGQPAATELPNETLLITDGRQRLNDGDPIEVIATPDPG